MSPKKLLGIFLCSYFMISIGFPVWGQQGKEIKQPHEKTRERIRMIKMWKLTETLKLDREEAARFFALTNQYEENKRKLRGNLQEDIQRLRVVMQELIPQEREMKELLSRIKARQRDLQEMGRKQTEEEMHLLKTEQQARYVLFQIDFHRDMENMIREVREEKSYRPGVEPGPEKNR